MRKHHATILSEQMERYGLSNRMISAAEIGVWKGQMSAKLLSRWEMLHLYMIDSFRPYDGAFGREGQSDYERMADVLKEAYWNTKEFEGRRSIIIADSVFAAAKFFGKHSLDVVFIDASHNYEDVKNDFIAWFDVVKPGGIFAGHDYAGKGDRRNKYGVKRAVDECAAERGYTVETEAIVWWFQK